MATTTYVEFDKDEDSLIGTWTIEERENDTTICFDTRRGYYTHLLLSHKDFSVKVLDAKKGEDGKVIDIPAGLIFTIATAALTYHRHTGNFFSSTYLAKLTKPLVE